MEKFQKYCLSVLLVIICSNISAQTGNGSLENDDCRLYEIYNQFLNHECEASEKLCVKEKPGSNFAIHQKQNAIDSIGKIFPEKGQHYSYKNKTGAGFSEKEKHNLLLKNFEKSRKENLLADISYFKTKVTKVRNKDYLNLVS
ncbi:hypothetical protein PFY12_08750 [Chryseobacterium camelliae]|uniref:Uncharacterized protein n=1 Tax=Chryseobacterium camelliae TaxID=1265445 RepID=A0ABY7QKG6_9FLAO|nr:hypothetical protein [Chryseobacterium camelliae]WBV59153.1 hypothetical protein PFY12_08750 [Chryseobacterium camelliae]